MSSFKLRSEKKCLNCGSSVEEIYCPHCGQENIELKENAVHMVTHTIADYFHFDNKFFKTLKPLLFKPGFLSLEYVKGKRMAYLHPIRLYIFVSIVFFILAFSNTNNKSEGTTKPSKATENRVRNEVSKEIDHFTYLSKEQKDSVKKHVINSSYKSDSGKRTKTFEEYLIEQNKLPVNKRDNFIERYLNKKVLNLRNSDNPTAKLIEYIPKMMFVLLPLFAIILKIVYIRKKRYYYEHLIYSFHLHAALFLSFIASKAINWATHYVYNLNWLLKLLLTVYIIWYIYRSLRTFYNSNRWVTLLKMFFLFMSYAILLSLCILGVVGIAV